MERQKNTGRIKVWVCRDWAGCHIFLEKPERINNGNPEDEWFADLASIDNVWSVRDMINDFTKGWNIDHKPEQITIKFEIL